MIQLTESWFQRSKSIPLLLAQKNPDIAKLADGFCDKEEVNTSASDYGIGQIFNSSEIIGTHFVIDNQQNVLM